MNSLTDKKNPPRAGAFKQSRLFFRKLSFRLLFRFFAQERKEWKIYFASLSEQEKAEIRRNRKRHLTAFLVSLSVHGLLVFILLSADERSVLIGEAGITAQNVLDFDIMDGMVSSQIQPVYDKAGGFIVNPSSLMSPYNRKRLSLSNLLKELKSSKGPVLSGGAAPSASVKDQKPGLRGEEVKLKAGLTYKKTRKRRRVRPDRTDLWSRVKFSKSGGAAKAQVNDGEIMKVIDKYSFQFQECYERALLRDETLAGKVVFLLKLSGSRVKKAGLEIKGNKGNTLSRREFSRCLFKESKSLVFSSVTEDISIKFNLIFGL